MERPKLWTVEVSVGRRHWGSVCSLQPCYSTTVPPAGWRVYWRVFLALRRLLREGN